MTVAQQTTVGDDVTASNGGDNGRKTIRLKQKTMSMRQTITRMVLM